MRVVRDTKVLVSGILFAGPPATILTAWAEGELELLVTVDILAVYRRVGDRLGEKYPSVGLDPVLDLVIRVSGNAACIVSGDHALLRSSGYEVIEVMTPRQFQTRCLQD